MPFAVKKGTLTPFFHSTAASYAVPFVKLVREVKRAPIELRLIRMALCVMPPIALVGIVVGERAQHPPRGQ